MSIHPRISVSNISTWKWSVAQDAAFLKAIGVGAIGLMSRKLDPDLEGAIAALQDAGLVVTQIAAAGLDKRLIAPADADGSPALRSLKPTIDIAAKLGCGCYFTAGTTPSRMPTDEAFDLLVAAVPPLKAYADQQGVPLSLEHSNVGLRDNGFVNTLRDAFEFAERTGLGVDVEIQNCWVERRLPEMIRDNISRVTLVQVSDYRVGETPRMNRRVLGDGDIPLEWLLGLLLDSGYKGYFEIETLGPAIEEEGYESSLKRSIAWLDERLTKWGV